MLLSLSTFFTDSLSYSSAIWCLWCGLQNYHLSRTAPHSAGPPVASWGCRSHFWVSHSQTTPFSAEPPKSADTLSSFSVTGKPTHGFLSSAAASGTALTKVTKQTKTHMKNGVVITHLNAPLSTYPNNWGAIMQQNAVMWATEPPVGLLISVTSCLSMFSRPFSLNYHFVSMFNHVNVKKQTLKCNSEIMTVFCTFTHRTVLGVFLTLWDMFGSIIEPTLKPLLIKLVF